jgi:NB-ARC domain/TIR domain
MTSIFLSYARGDDERFVRRLYEDLTGRGHEVWWDRACMPNRALTFLQEIRDAIARHTRLLLVLGPKALSSEYVTAEWRFALEIGKAINPVLRRGDFPLLPEELKLLDTPDFRDDDRYAESLATLLRQVAEPVAPMGKLIAVPSLPAHFLHKAERLRALRDAVLADLQRPVVVTGTAARSGIHGMSGIGKSVLAVAFAHDHQVRRAFPDGILWVSIGQRPNLTGLQEEMARALGDMSPFLSIAQGKHRLKELLADRAVLVILDDVWQGEDAQYFDVLGSRCRLLLTTRNAALITALCGTEYRV